MGQMAFCMNKVSYRIVLYPLIDIVIIQIIRNTPPANGKMLKNEKMHVQLERLHLQDILSHKSFAQYFIKKKNRKDFHSYTVCDYRKESKTHFYATKRCWLTTRKPFFTKMFTNLRFLLANVAVHDEQTEIIISGRQTCMYSMIEWLCGCAT